MLILNSIVKNEAARIERMLESVAPFIGRAVIIDTGSTDGTPDVIAKFFSKRDIPCYVHVTEFKDFSQARNEALRSAKLHAPSEDDYLLLVDADMELRVTDPKCFEGLTAPSYDMYQIAGTLHYQNRRLVRVGSTGEYRGVTHEYLNVDSGGFIPEEKAVFLDHADGSNRTNKFVRDIRLLKDGLKAEPNNERYFYYLAQSYRDAGKHLEAIRWYERRIQAGGWPEEVWSAQLHKAECYKTLGNEAEFIRQSLLAYNMRPSRAESVYGLANHFRNESKSALSCLFAEEAMRIPKTTDALFVNDYAYTVGPMEELSISGFYVENKKKHAFTVTDKLALMKGPYAGSRELARRNMYWYLPRLSESCPSFESRRIDFDPPDGWKAMNPSVANVNGSLMCVVRTVNYTMDDNGRYLIKDVADDGVCGCNANDTNPINTRNWLLWLGADPMTLTHPVANELLPPGNLPAPLFKQVVGFEDMRLFSYKNEMWVSACMRETTVEGRCEQVLAKVRGGYGSLQLSDWKRMPTSNYEKNWMPIDGDMRWMYRLDKFVNDKVEFTDLPKSDFDVGQISGGSQVIPFNGGRICLVHEARPLPDKPHKRYYWHRFAYLDHEFKLTHLSHPFVFDDKQIEFAAGLCWHPDGKRLVISYGVRDEEARIALVDEKEVGKMLWFPAR